MQSIATASTQVQGRMEASRKRLPRIRPAATDDLDELIELGRKLHSEGAFAFLPFEESKVKALALRALNEPQRYAAFIAEIDGAIVGLIAGYLTEYYFCHEKLAVDLLLFVDQEYRGGPAALKLIDAYRRWARIRGAREICIGISTGLNIDKAGRLLERAGLTRVGGTYKQRLF